MNQKNQALVVDDEPDIQILLKMTLEKMNIAADCADNLQQARILLEQQDYQICLTDMRLPDGDGLELVELIQQQQPDLPVAVITAHGSMDTAIQALKAGAFDFISKPVELRNLRETIAEALRLAESPPSIDPLQHQIQESPEPISQLIGQSEAMRHLKNQMIKVARSQAPVFIHGPSGSGKERVAKSIHELSSRKAGPFIGVNCGAIPAELIESEFFGHQKGAFTGATTNKEGLFQSADLGTLFLDEVADLPLALQVKLLRAIQEKSIRPVGSQKEIRVNVRLLSASHQNLAQAVESGRFRQDLFFRLHVIVINVPPLNQRGQDILLLAKYYLKKISNQNEQAEHQLSPTAAQALLAYDFPGNVRELENILERACALNDHHLIEASDLMLPDPLIEQATQFNSTIPTEKPNQKKISPQLSREPSELNPILTETIINHTSDYDSDTMGLEAYLEQVEREAILKTLALTKWNRTQAAKKLGITFRALRYRLKKLNLD